MTNDEQAKLRVEAWKTTVDVQKHFNDLELRIRNFALTILTAVLGAVGVSIKERVFIQIGSFSVSLAVWFLGIGALSWLAFYFMDRWWYHSLLRAAVQHGMSVEEKLEVEVPTAFGLTTAISKASPFTIRGEKVHSAGKMDFFYIAIVVVLVVAAIVLHFVVIVPAPSSPAP